VTRSAFDPLVDAYDAGRPSYPDQLYDDLERLTRPLRGADVVEVGAGTGIATRALEERGARVVALDLGPAMLRRLLDRSQRTPVAVAVAVAHAHALPLRDGVADLVCYAQAWHWVRVPEAAAEARRVLRPGGALATWWNDVSADDLPWWQAQQDRLEGWSPGYSRDYRRRDWSAELTGVLGVEQVEVAGSEWVRSLPIEQYETWLRSKSYVAALGDRLEDFLAAERASLAAAFPDGAVQEPFRTVLVVARVA
jgi:SAM-dependent methyltransferase